MFRDQTESLNTVGNLLLLGNDFRSNRIDAIAASRTGYFQDWCGDSGRGAETERRFMRVNHHFRLDCLEPGENLFDHAAPILGKIARCEKELVIGHKRSAIGPRAINQQPGLGGGRGGGVIGVPDCPGIDRAPLESSARIGWRQIERRDIAIIETGLFEHPNQQLMDIGPFVQRNFLFFEVRHRLDRAVFRYQNSLTMRCGGLDRDIDERRAGRPREDGGSFTGGAEIDRTDIERLQQLWAVREFKPLDPEPLRFQRRLQRARLAQKHKRIILLIADVQNLFGGQCNWSGGRGHHTQQDDK